MGQAFLMRCDARPSAPAPPIEGITLAEGSLEDADDILEIYQACGFEQRSPEAMRAAMQDGRHAHALARHEGRAVAFAELETHWPLRVWVAYVGVTMDLRDRGVGSHLVSWALGRRFDAGAVTGLLMLSPANRTALRTYEKAPRAYGSLRVRYRSLALVGPRARQRRAGTPAPRGGAALRAHSVRLPLWARPGQSPVRCGPASAPGMSAVIFTLGMGNAVEEVIGSMVDDPRPGDPRRGRPASDLP
jgi:ribosomal protein S18 acetylase RimI-like enzyme